MKDFAGRIAVVTGGGSGMGRELVRQLVAEGCNVATCDVFAEAMAETKRLCEADRLPQGLRITTHIADVSDEAQVQRFRDDVAAQQETDKIHLLFNNAGIGGGGSMLASSREEWEKTFNVCWGGVYHNTGVPTNAAAGRRGPHRQHEQHQRLLGIDWTARSTHRLFCSEIRSERLYRSANHRPPNECAPYQMLGRDARPNRNFHSIQLSQDP